MNANMDPTRLAAELRASREHLDRITVNLDGERLWGPKLIIVNPPLWELGHVGWFQEFWCLRHSARKAPPEPLISGADALYNSAKVAHDTRWDLPLPDLKATRSYLANVLERVTQRLEQEPENAELHYFAQLAMFHEDMHSEAFHYTRQTLGYSDPWRECQSASAPEPKLEGYAKLTGGTFLLGALRNNNFVHDNEKWAHEVTIEPFSIARTPVTNGEFLAFVEVDGYGRREWWSDDGWSWRTRTQQMSPKYWVRKDNAWLQRRFDQLVALDPDEPVVHVNWHEANAYCRFAGLRLPTEAEWEYAAAFDQNSEEKRHYAWGSAFPSPQLANLESARITPVQSHAHGDSPWGCRQMIGNVWEWTATAFGPYPEFTVDPYKEYSEPWFGTHKVLRGGSFATTRRLIRNTWRNFYTPDRNDIFAGFRTCTLDR